MRASLFSLWRWVSLMAILGWAVPVTAAEPATEDPGLAVEYSSLPAGGSRDLGVVPTLALHVAPGGTPSPFLPAGPFTVTWTGHINAEIRSDYLFQAEFSGSFRLEINGQEVLRSEGVGVTSPFSKPVRLTKGANALKATFQSPSQGEAFLRVGWAEKAFLVQPLPATVLSHGTDAALGAALERRAGRESMIEFRCLRCHATSVVSNGVPELAMDAPSLDGIGGRRSYDWMRRWIENPRGLRPTAHMPRVFRGPAAPEEARAVAAYLASLKPAASEGLADPAPWRLLAPPPAAAVAGTEVGPLFESLHCAACHTPPDVAQAEEGKIPLRHVREKFPDGALADFLRRPSARYHWIRMPDFRLTASEASALAEGLLKLAPAPEGGAAPPAPAEAALLEKGKGLVQSSGCLNCHPHSLENRSRAPQFDTFKPESWTRGCLATGSEAGGGAPDFTLAPGVVAGLRAVGATDRTSLQRHVPSEFASRESRLLRCTACHGQFDGFPAFDVLGGKLRPEWAAAFIGGQVDYKPRGERHPKGEPWLSARMPAFGPYAALLAPGMAESSGFAPSSPPPAAARPPDEALAAVGRKLLGKVGGFSCVSCHGVNAMPALEVFESEGINLALTGSRIRREYFQRWMRLPLAVDPSTKMPAYFDEEGHSPLTEVFEGDALRQLEAIWEFLKLGEKMTPPELGEAK